MELMPEGLVIRGERKCDQERRGLPVGAHLRLVPAYDPGLG